jgi:hypothetical protein
MQRFVATKKATDLREFPQASYLISK